MLCSKERLLQVITGSATGKSISLSSTVAITPCLSPVTYIFVGHSLLTSPPGISTGNDALIPGFLWPVPIVFRPVIPPQGAWVSFQLNFFLFRPVQLYKTRYPDTLTCGTNRVRLCSSRPFWSQPHFPDSSESSGQQTDLYLKIHSNLTWAELLQHSQFLKGFCQLSHPQRGPQSGTCQIVWCHISLLLWETGIYSPSAWIPCWNCWSFWLAYWVHVGCWWAHTAPRRTGKGRNCLSAHQQNMVPLVSRNMTRKHSHFRPWANFGTQSCLAEASPLLDIGSRSTSPAFPPVQGRISYLFSALCHGTDRRQDLSWPCWSCVVTDKPNVMVLCSLSRSSPCQMWHLDFNCRSFRIIRCGHCWIPQIPSAFINLQLNLETIRNFFCLVILCTIARFPLFLPYRLAVPSIAQACLHACMYCIYRSTWLVDIQWRRSTQK